MKPKFTLLLLGLAMAGCSSTQAPQTFEAENLIQKMPLPAGAWHVYQGKRNDTNMLETRWVSKTSRDIAQTFVIYGAAGSDVTRSKSADDKLGSSKCDQLFESHVISAEQQNGYEQLTWMSECKNSDGYYSKTLHKTIAGNDSEYAFKRIFKTQPDEARWQLWLGYINDIHVCDSRTTVHPCPEGFKRIK